MLWCDNNCMYESKYFHRLLHTLKLASTLMTFTLWHETPPHPTTRHYLPRDGQDSSTAMFWRVLRGSSRSGTATLWEKHRYRIFWFRQATLCLNCLSVISLVQNSLDEKEVENVVTKSTTKSCMIWNVNNTTLKLILNK